MTGYSVSPEVSNEMYTNKVDNITCLSYQTEGSINSPNLFNMSSRSDTCPWGDVIHTQSCELLQMDQVLQSIFWIKFLNY